MWRDSLRRLLRNRQAVIGLAFITVFILGGVLAPLIPPHDPGTIRLTQGLRPPNLTNLLGTDELGRSELSRVLYGGRLSLLVGFAATSWSLLLGGLMGTIAGTFGGRVDAVIMRLTDILLAFPGLLLAIGIVSWLGRGELQITVAVGIAYAPVFARLLRGSLMSVQERDYILAARAVGVRRPRLVFRYLLPNALTPVIVQATLALGTAIVDIAGLGFLGLGPADPGIPEWGSMLIDGVQFLYNAPYLVFVPGAALALTVIGFNLLGDGLRQSLDPRLRT